jgi:hypothetical protein
MSPHKTKARAIHKGRNSVGKKRTGLSFRRYPSFIYLLYASDGQSGIPL